MGKKLNLLIKAESKLGGCDKHPGEIVQLYPVVLRDKDGALLASTNVCSACIDETIRQHGKHARVRDLRSVSNN
jgi:hypothetical protein